MKQLVGYGLLLMSFFMCNAEDIGHESKKKPLFVDRSEAVEKESLLKEYSQSWHYRPAPFPFSTEPEWYTKISGAYVVELSNASLFSNKGIVVINNERIYQDSLWIWSPLYKAPKDLFPLPEAQTVPYTVATIALEGHSNYFHWITEILPRLHLLQTMGAEYDYLYTPPLNFQFQKDTLALFGIDLKKVIEGTKTTHIKPKKVIFPSQVARSCITPHWSVPFLQKHILRDYKITDGKKRIFISRKNASIRRILNEDELFAVVEPFGFEKVFMEKLSILEQAQLAHESEIIMGTHGAGMTNIIFARKGTTVIEIFQEHLDECFCDLSDVMGLNYHCIKTERVPELSQEHIDIRYRNTFVKVDLFKDTLQLLFEKLTLVFN